MWRPRIRRWLRRTPRRRRRAGRQLIGALLLDEIVAIEAAPTFDPEPRRQSASTAATFADLLCSLRNPEHERRNVAVLSGAVTHLTFEVRSPTVELSRQDERAAVGVPGSYRDRYDALSRCSAPRQTEDGFGRGDRGFLHVPVTKVAALIVAPTLDFGLGVSDERTRVVATQGDLLHGPRQWAHRDRHVTGVVGAVAELP